MAQLVKNLPAVQETWVRSLGWEDPWRRAWEHTPVFLPRESRGQRSLAGCGPSVQFSPVTQLCLTLCDPMNHSMPGLPVHHQLLESPKPMSIESVMPFNHLILCHPLLFRPPIPPSIRVFSNEMDTIKDEATVSNGEGNGTPLQYSCLENPMDEGAWQAAVHGVVKSPTVTERLHSPFSLSCTGEGNGNPLQCSCLENPRDGGAWWAAVCGVTQSRTRLN